jgi:hypothetical protein
MDPWMSNDIAKARSEEKLARGLAAYQALSAREGQAAEVGPEAGGAGRLRLVDRLRRSGADTPVPARPAI